MSLFGEASSPVERCISFNGNCPTKFAVNMNMNNVKMIAMCFCALSLPILAFAMSLKYLISPSAHNCNFPGTSLRFLVAINATTIKSNIVNHIVIMVSILIETPCPKRLKLYIQCSIFLPHSISC